MSTIPTIDLAAFEQATGEKRGQIAAEVDRICRTIGFLIVNNHGVDPSIIDGAWNALREFFALPQARKGEVQPDDPGCPRGYSPPEGESLARTLGQDTMPDRKESFSTCPLRAPVGAESDPHFDFFYGENYWPVEPTAFRRCWTDYYHAMEDLGSRVMALFAAALGQQGDYFARFHTHHLGALRGLRYLPWTGAARAGEFGAGAHCDYGSVTILKPDPDVPGLEIRPRGGEWTAAPRVRDGFIINLGDMMACWTNDRWVSTLHRVTGPKDDQPRVERHSIAYFHNPNHDARIECIPGCSDQSPRYLPVTAGRYLVEKFTAAIEG